MNRKEKQMTNMDCKLNLGYDGKIVVEGSIDFLNVSLLTKQGKAFITENKEITVDLLNLSNSNSSALAMIVQWQRHALKYKHQISFINCSGLLLDVSRVCGLDEVLYFK